MRKVVGRILMGLCGISFGFTGLFALYYAVIPWEPSFAGEFDIFFRLWLLIGSGAYLLIAAICLKQILLDFRPLIKHIKVENGYK